MSRASSSSSNNPTRFIETISLTPMRRATSQHSALRRNVISRMAQVGAAALAATSFSSVLSEAIAKGDVPVIQGIHQMTGQVFVNGKPATVGREIKVGDRVKVGPNSSAVVVFEKDAYLLRANSEVVFETKAVGSSNALQALRLVSGAMLAVFKKGEPKMIQTRVATVGIRGTGAYFESYENKVYFCLCYGTADVSGQGMDKPMTVETKYHESPLWLTDVGNKMVMEKGPFLNHTDAELEMLEGLCGRTTPFNQLPPGTARY
jgi:hypothetical protein